MGFVATVSGVGSFGATVDQQSALLATMAVMGPKGDTGATGGTGATGPQGPAGDAATIAVGTTSTLAPGSSATVSNSGTSSAAVFNFGIPEGEKGDKGDTGDTGATGPQGPQGIPGVVAATAPIQYDAPTQTVSIDPTYKPNPFDQSLNTTDSPSFASIGATDGTNTISVNPHWLAGVEHTAGAYIGKIGALSGLTHTDGTNTISVSTSGITFTDATTQTTAGLSPADAAATYYPLTNPAGYISDVPAASTTVAGKVELATDAEAVAGASTTLAVTPSNLLAYHNQTNNHDYKTEGFTASTSGTGATNSQNFGIKLVSAPTSVVGHSTLINGWQTATIGANANAGFDWSKKIDFVFRFNRQIGTADPNSLFRILCGKATNGYTVGDLAGRGMGIRCVNGSALELQVHNGTTLTNVTSSFTPTTNVTYSARIYSDGAGNVTLWVDGNQVATTTAGATTGSNSTGNGLAFEAQNIGTVTGTKAQIQVSNYQVTIS